MSMYPHVYNQGVKHTWYNTYNADATKYVLSMRAHICDQGVTHTWLKHTRLMQPSMYCQCTRTCTTREWNPPGIKHATPLQPRMHVVSLYSASGEALDYSYRNWVVQFWVPMWPFWGSKFANIAAPIYKCGIHGFTREALIKAIIGHIMRDILGT